MLKILQHTIGADQYGHRKGDRNHFVSGNSGTDLNHCLEAVELGLMKERTSEVRQDLIGGDGSRLFHATGKGIDFVGANSDKPPKISKAQARYKRWLSLNDCFDSFIDFCRWDADQERSWN